MSTHQDRYPVVTYTDNRTGRKRPGGQCRCCGAGPSPDSELLIRKAGLCDADGVFYAMLCDYCLDEILAKQAKRQPTARDEKARLVVELLEDDLDGMEAMMEDLPDLDQLLDKE